MATITLLIIGFSVFSAAILLIAYVFFLKDMQKTVLGVVACAILLGSLCGLQLFHLEFLQSGTDLFDSRLYAVLLIATPSAFYFFSREILLPNSGLSGLQALHLLPLFLGFILPVTFVVPVALAVGAGYSVWFARFVFGMRKHVRRYRFEVFFFSFFALLALLVLALAFLRSHMPPAVFYIAYANFTGISLILVTLTLVAFPELLLDISDAAKLSYEKSTLNEVNIDAKLAQLETVMRDEKLFQNEELNLAMLAEALMLTSHQLSELINRQFGYGFSRYVREIRVAEARKLLQDDRRSSVLAISMMTGFRSQSNFYAAFREITGEAPGNYRKKRQPNA
ncbi:MAG TPA: helix-turn-helix domain-containing protein [Woeseiaceae bacterium]|nr:helix-turn-helix domain-containing protein [Woeseiaceae bacterium]